jgi:hypothetical protein
MNSNQRDESFEKAKKLCQSLTFEDIQDDYEFFQQLILKHHPDGKFSVIQDVQPTSTRGELQIRPSLTVLEFMHYLFSKYKDPIRVRAVSSKIYNDFILKK